MVSGPPGVGKTTLALRFAEKTHASGFVTLELREAGKRVGFKIHTLPDGEEALFAHVSYPGPRIGRYGVDVAKFEALAIHALQGEGLLVVDEIGPMELLSKKFQSELKRVLQKRPFLATVHRSIAQKWAKCFGAKLFWLTRENRNNILREVIGLWKKENGAPAGI